MSDIPTTKSSTAANDSTNDDVISLTLSSTSGRKNSTETSSVEEMIEIESNSSMTSSPLDLTEKSCPPVAATDKDDVRRGTDPPNDLTSNDEYSEDFEEDGEEETKDDDTMQSKEELRTIVTEQPVANQNELITDDFANISKTPLENGRDSAANENLKNNNDYNSGDDFTMPGLEALQCPKRIMRDLAEPGFDVWRLDRDSMVDHIEYMYHDLGVVRAWRIPRATLRMFLLGVRERYQDNPYHNFKHCFCVTQMAYSMMCKLRLRGSISVDYLGALLTAAVCHDVDHPGLNNSYHCHARTPLAILYNYKSILEQHHFAVTCRILSNKERNIFRNVNNRDEVLTNVGELILATDLARHKEVMDSYARNVADGFDFKNNDHVMSVLKIIIKCADVSNEVRPETIASPWVDCLFAEYSEQCAREKRERLPVTTYMDPELVNVAESQENFIRGIMLPMYDQLCKLIVDARLYYVNPLYEALMRYEVQSIRESGI